MPRRAQPRTRRLPGPLVLVLVVFVWLALTPATVRAHAPGLSALDVSVSRGAISLTLSVANADIQLVAADGRSDPRDAVEALAATAIHVSIDGHELSSASETASTDETSVRVQRVFSVPELADGPRRLVVSSEIPARLARGHRELLIVTSEGGVMARALLDADSASATVDLEGLSPSASRIAWSFLKLGNQHILSGYDHLLFLAGLFLAAGTVRKLLVLLSAFTVAHSISLALVVIGGVHLPASFVEPAIAASIAWVGLENLVRDQYSGRWVVVFLFGLIHGFGFAGALLDLGFGSSVGDVVLALVSFNAGVESGQLLVALLIVPLLWTIRRHPIWRATLMPACSVLLAIAGACWMVARLSL